MASQNDFGSDPSVYFLRGVSEVLAVSSCVKV